jgi:hypothetical protein
VQRPPAARRAERLLLAGVSLTVLGVIAALAESPLAGLGTVVGFCLAGLGLHRLGRAGPLP